MKITFQFDNGTSRVILEPENERDKMYLNLCVNAGRNLSLDAGKAEQLVIKFAGETQ